MSAQQRELLRFEQIHCELTDYCQREVILQREQIRNAPVKSLRPELEAVARIDKPHGDSQEVGRLFDCALENSIYIEASADLAGIDLHAFECESGAASHHEQCSYFGERAEQLLRQSVAKVVIVRVGA